MSVFTTQPEPVTIESVRHDYSRAFASDPDDIDLRRCRFDRWLVEYARLVAANAWAEGWEQGQAHAEEWYLHGVSDPDTSIRSNPYLTVEEES
ncbi:hypothetical protein EP30_05395 [Bifidobacterium sp. UTCIF-39]|uniref:hypothetical protein n=1 Tax=Bifidobacterium sp. UTCIF-39 TaxID=1465359 RepID=UPI00112EED2B|nr:hypothetical protein [Bifidobacterium sp. UTCIF-39]TPF96852.1 hypothetical protein EP30_05395 [Bifidobacterium sp. UTCIF-39]